ncbi:MAG: NAD(P)/FAD-dependent oxidoreductase [Caldithrix sp.]|nr:MAG: NAD(P)/FAD-dependent oxidoreductase [Caldithrix sp.]
MPFDVVVIGGGVNALTAASYLAKAGRKVTIVCPTDQIGGLCSRHEFYPGFTSPGILYDTSMFRSWVVDELGLKDHGLTYAKSTKTLAFGKDQHIILSEHIDETAEEIAKVSSSDAKNYKEMKAFYGKISGPIIQFLNTIPADIVDPQSSDLWSLFKRGFQLRKLGKKDMLEVLRLAPMAVYDWLDEWFENDGLKAALALLAVTESYSGPWSPGTNANLLIQQVSRGSSVKGDGLALVSALEKAAKSFGAHFETKAKVSAIQPGKGVDLEDNSFIEAKTIVAACGPKNVFLEMMDARHLSNTFEQRVTKFRTRGLCSQLLLAVNKAPSLVGNGEANRILIAEDLDSIERAFDPIKYDEVTSHPCLEIYLPSQEHNDLAPTGQAVISVLIHYTPYSLKGGWTGEAREKLCDNVIETLDNKIPGIKQSIVGKELLTPQDIQERYDLSGGQLCEGEHALDQLLVRPTPECSQYKTPFDGLYLCSGGSFPGGGLTGAPGALAVKMVLRK